MEYRLLDTPFLPKAPVKTVLIDGRIPRDIENNLRHFCIDIVKLPFCNEVYEAIACHPDILMHPVNSNTVVAAPNVFDFFNTRFSNTAINIVKGSTVLTRNYPSNIAYNIGRVGKYVIHNLNYTDRVTLKLLEKDELSFIHVKQGYSKCSIGIVNENSIITSDRGIAKALEKIGIDVLCISPGYIELPGLEYGFFGGISGLIDRNKLAFTGHLRYHPDYKRIIDFLQKHKIEPVFLDKGISKDVGSIIPIFQMEY